MSHAISDDDDGTLGINNSACSKIATLRENHLQALRVAAANAMVAPAPSGQAVAPAAAWPTMNQAKAMAKQQAAFFATVAPFPQQVTTTIRIPKSSGDSVAYSSKEMFPMRLRALLADPTVCDVVSWLPHGKSFVVLRPDVFATRVLPRYFAPEGSNSLNAKTTTALSTDGSLTINNKTQGVHKYPSFTRKLNRWGFRQISRGLDAGAFCHDLFQRDDPELCRSMVCQKSRKSTKRSVSGAVGIADDLMSVSSASTMGTKSVTSCEKRPFSSTVTVSTAGGTSNKSLPFKKRKSGQHITNSFMMNDIPSMISHRPQKMAASTSSVTESDLTSDNGSVCSNNAVVHKFSDKAAVQVQAVNNAAQTMNNAAQAAEAQAREALARHFHEQHRAFALASLMENSRSAMAGFGMRNQACAAAASSSVQSSQNQCQQYVPVLGAMTTHSPSVLAHTVTIPEDKKMPANVPAGASLSSAEAAKIALYKAYLQALSSHMPPTASS